MGLSIGEIAGFLEKNLENIVRDIAKDNNVQDFVDDVDLLEDRLKKWHQFGLITHMRKVRKAFVNEIWGFFRKWRVYSNIEEELSESIDGVSKKILLEISIPLHDLGKIVCHKSDVINRGHEFASARLVEEDYLKSKLEGYGLSVKQIDYIVRCVETHFSLGQEMRDALKHDGLLNMEYLLDLNNQDEIERLCTKISDKYSDVKTEIGVFFLADCLGKTDVRGALNIPDEDEAKTDIEKEILDRGLPVELANAAKQLPLSVKLAEIYLKSIYR
jgi:hypothetical protein